jgi:uncharacterized protein
MIGLISDTHGLLREEAVTALAGCELIVHAGDVGQPEILDRLRAIAPLVVVRGNIDKGGWASALPETAVAECAGVNLYILHDVHALDLNPAAGGFDVVVSGHSHQPSQSTHDGVLYVNPGSAGPRRFKLPITIAKLDPRVRPLQVDFVSVG